jgi:uncharacterized alkaline shock family protein YloU
MATEEQHAPTSERMTLAALARQAALDSHEVASLDVRPPLAHTAAASEQIDGVACIAAPGGGYEVTLYVIARPVSLQRAASNLRERVRRSVEAHGLGDELRTVNVSVTDVVPEERSR